MKTIVSATEIANAMRQHGVSSAGKIEADKDEIIPEASIVISDIGGLTHVPVVECEVCGRLMRKNNIERHRAAAHGIGKRMKMARKKCKKCGNMIAGSVFQRHVDSDCRLWIRREVPLSNKTAAARKNAVDVDKILDSIISAIGGLNRNNLNEYLKIESMIREAIKT